MNIQYPMTNLIVFSLITLASDSVMAAESEVHRLDLTGSRCDAHGAGQGQIHLVHASQTAPVVATGYIASILTRMAVKSSHCKGV
jgi:hypothetical protein